MPSVKAKGYTMDRRAMMKITGTVGLGATFLNPELLLAAEKCQFIIMENGEIDASQSGKTLQFWIDGMHLVGNDQDGKVKNFTDLPSRANITLFMDILQTPISYVESVVLMDENNVTLGARFFDASMKMQDGHVPYVTFEGVTLDSTKEYKVVYTEKRGSDVKLWTAVIKNPTLSRFNTTWLAQEMRDDFQTFQTGDKNITPGLVTTPFQYYTDNGIGLHSARGRFTDIGSDGEFTCKIDFMHGDGGAEHFMRYFIVMDPVGRLLGFHRRTFGDGMSGSVDVSPANSEWGAPFNVANLQRGDIRDCPWVQIYTEDVFDAIARSTIRLR
jgi:hypothetical protein